MKTTIITTPNFRECAKKLSQKYPTLKKDLEELMEQMKINPTVGTKLENYTDQFRVAVKHRGSQHGLNIITKVVFQVQTKGKKEATVYLADIFDKIDRKKPVRV